MIIAMGIAGGRDGSAPLACQYRAGDRDHMTRQALDGPHLPIPADLASALEETLAPTQDRRLRTDPGSLVKRAIALGCTWLHERLGAEKVHSHQCGPLPNSRAIGLSGNTSASKGPDGP